MPDEQKAAQPAGPPVLSDELVLCKLCRCRTIYNMCTQKPPYDYSEQLYSKYREALSSYITGRVSTWPRPREYDPQCLVCQAEPFA